MGTSQADKARNHDRIVAIAARLIREEGLENFSVAEVMKAAGLTHGGFYGHFGSRAAMVAASLEQALQASEAGLEGLPGRDGAERRLSAVAGRYLTPGHRDDPGSGCPIAALAGEASRADPEVRAIMTARLERMLDELARIDGGEQPEAMASAALALMVGGLVLSRMLSGTPRSDEVLRHAQQAVSRLEAGAWDGES